MARLHPLESAEAPWIVRPVYWLSRRLFGKVLTPAKVMAHRPGLLYTSAFLGRVLDKANSIDPRLHTLIALRTAQIIGCPF